jgi:hypothetical protein
LRKGGGIANFLPALVGSMILDDVEPYTIKEFPSHNFHIPRRISRGRLSSLLIRLGREEDLFGTHRVPGRDIISNSEVGSDERLVFGRGCSMLWMGKLTVRDIWLECSE